MSEKRFPSSLFSQGKEPDPRFSLANERTFLAWIRTSLALILAGVAIEIFEFPTKEILRTIIAVVLISLGIISSLRAWIGWIATEKSLRNDKPLPGINFAPGLSILLALVAALIIFGLFL